MIIPIGHESSTVRRLPWVTFGVMAICIIVHLFTGNAMEEKQQELQRLIMEFEEYFISHPYLQFPPKLEKLFFTNEQERDILLEAFSMAAAGVTDEDRIAHEQEKLNSYADQIIETLESTPYRRWGFVPADKSFIGLIAHMFMHGGWLHLFGNLFILYLSGPFIEDVWGRPLYLTFYLIMGVFAAMMFALHYPNSSTPLIGASGAIAGVMGAFLIRYWKARIKFFYIFLIVFRGTFLAPAWVALPLWLTNEVLNAKVMDSIAPEGGGGVAHWAHIWGFVLGAFVAYAIKVAKIEEKYVNPKIEAQITFVDNKIIDDAMQLKMQGNQKKAYYVLRDAVRKDPSNSDLVMALWNLGLEMEKGEEVAQYFIKLIEMEFRNKEVESGILHYRQLRMNLPNIEIKSPLKVKLIEGFWDFDEVEEAEELARELYEEIDETMPAGFMIRFSRILLKLESDFAEKIIKLTLQRSDIPGEIKEELRSQIKESSYEHTEKIVEYVPVEPEKPKMSVARKEEPIEKMIEEEKPIKSLKVTKAVPIAVKGKKLGLQIENLGKKAFPLEKVHTISVVKITAEEERPFLLLDLFLEDPLQASGEIRVIRFFSTTFDPRKLVPKAQSALRAFQMLTLGLMKLSGAEPYPDLESVQFKKVASFATIKEYESIILE